MSDYLKKRMDYINAGRPIPEKKKYKLNNVAPKTAAKIAAQQKENSKEKKEETLNEWFQKIEDKHWGTQDLDADGFDHEENVFELPRCMECGVKISRLFARHAIAHLLPKKIFKSIATNDLNYLLLGAGCGCHNKTHMLSTFSKMKVWPQAAKQINQLLPLLPFDELRYISYQLYDSLENY